MTWLFLSPLAEAEQQFGAYSMLGVAKHLETLFVRRNQICATVF